MQIGVARGQIMSSGWVERPMSVDNYVKMHRLQTDGVPCHQQIGVVELGKYWKIPKAWAPENLMGVGIHDVPGSKRE
jgi:hypothetical protein